MTRRKAGAAARIFFVALWSATLLIAAPGSASRLDAEALPLDATSESDDELFLDVAHAVPGFAGAYLDADGNTLIVSSTRPSNTAAQEAQRLLAVHFDAADARTVIAREARYSFEDLHTWRTRLTTDVFRASDGVVFTDVDEFHNRVTIGVQDAQRDGPPVEALVDSLDIPHSAVRIEETEPFEALSDLRDIHRPVVGGLQMQYQEGFLSSGPLCTVGWVALRKATGVKGFITNSHCTPTIGARDDGSNTTLFQPDRDFLENNGIGWEAIDPATFTHSDDPACPRGRQCRRSDSIFAGPVLDSSEYKRGVVAKPPYGSTAWTTGATLSIDSESTALVGQSVVKIGRSTGLTSGNVTRTCVDASIRDTDYTILCETTADFDVAPGDSGSPVLQAGSTSARALYGIVWGGPAIFSGIGSIETELGALNSCASGISC
ncbi:MAG TPA: hypothetical protein VHJ34_06935 [Actinomycetota bacterium]|nr:hypothetical protein [Actinomycetota bacterium]